jgi:cation diffusion facilitator CzcD-associated flavoprotein CzcO
MSSVSEQVPVIIVGAGPAGLAAGACLRRRGITPLIFEAGDAPGTSWRRLYERLHLHTVKALSGLPGLPMPRQFPRYPSRAQVVEYLATYASHFDLKIETNCPVTAATPEGESWRVTTPKGDYHASVLISATGIFSQPVAVSYPGMNEFKGQLLHASAYYNAVPFAGQRVLVVGAGNSGAEIAVDLAEHGAATTIAIRAGANVVPRELLGVPIQRWGFLIAAMPRSLTNLLAPVLLRRSVRRQARAGVPRPALGVLEKPGIPIIGLELLQYAQQGKISIAGAIERFTEAGVCFTDGQERAFDAIILATGYRPALAYLNGVAKLDEQGRPLLEEGVRAAGVPNLYFVGMNYNIRGTLYNIAREAPLVADLIAQSARKR